MGRADHSPCELVPLLFLSDQWPEQVMASQDSLPSLTAWQVQLVREAADARLPLGL